MDYSIFCIMCCIMVAVTGFCILSVNKNNILVYNIIGGLALVLGIIMAVITFIMTR